MHLLHLGLGIFARPNLSLNQTHWVIHLLLLLPHSWCFWSCCCGNHMTVSCSVSSLSERPVVVPFYCVCLVPELVSWIQLEYGPRFKTWYDLPEIPWALASPTVTLDSGQINSFHFLRRAWHYTCHLVQTFSTFSMRLHRRNWWYGACCLP